MPIVFHETSNTFHLQNKTLSYVLKVLPHGGIGLLYCGKAIRDRAQFDHLFETAYRGMAVCVFEGDKTYCLDHIKQEFPVPLAGDMRVASIDLKQNNGSRVVDFRYAGHEIFPGKPKLDGLPATYVEDDAEATTLWIHLHDERLRVTATLQYTLYADRPVLTRSVRIHNEGDEVVLDGLSSLNLDLPDADYDLIELTGAWARERSIHVERLRPGLQSIYSLRGHSSSGFNPFLGLKRPETTEAQGEAWGFSLVYSGNFLAQVDVDAYHTARVNIGMHPFTFSWPLRKNESFQSPEAVMVYSDQGTNGMSQAFHSLFRDRLARGVWRDKPRPILLNNWEGTYFDFRERDLVEMAREAKDLGVELFVLDDGWFEGRNTDRTSLGDWRPDRNKLPDGIAGLSNTIHDLGLKFGLWFEPEMVNKRSRLYEAHPDWVLQTPNRHASHGRNQFVLDFSNPDVVDFVFEMMKDILDHANIDYIKWDMNRSMSEVYSTAHGTLEQGTIYHRYILGVYALYERLIERYPNILFESCASGGARFDPGMLYYAPQAWTSDDTDAIERLKIQYGTSMLYPISSMGSHVSAIPNHQLNRSTPLSTRANVAYFGTFGYELDPRKMDESEKEQIRKQIGFMKQYRSLIQFGTFYRLLSPFDGNETAWMVVSNDQKTAIVGYYRTLQEVNERFRRVRLQGLDPNALYQIEGCDYDAYGDELMYAGLITTDASAGEHNLKAGEGDYLSRLYILHQK